MGIRKAKPTSPGMRSASFQDFSDITSVKPEKSLIVIRKQHSGRNSGGKITVRHQGGGAKRYLRMIFRESLRLLNMIQVAVRVLRSLPTATVKSAI